VRISQYDSQHALLTFVFEDLENEDSDEPEVDITGMNDSSWAPYGCKTVGGICRMLVACLLTLFQLCLLDILDNLPRLRLSSSQLKMVLWVMRECGAKNVPSFDSFCKMQQRLRDVCSVPIQPIKSDLGNRFHTTNPCEFVARVRPWPLK
jgi:hypothetical protein